MDKKTSAISGFYKLSRKERIAKVAEFSGLSDEAKASLEEGMPLDFEIADRMAENAISLHSLPFCIATNFTINGKDYLVPMAIEEPSVVAAASFAAKLCRDTGGFSASADPPIMIGQIQLVGADADDAARRLESSKEEIIAHARSFAQGIEKYGGGLRGFSARKISTKRGDMAIAEFHIDVRDSMGANTINTILEGVAPKVSEIAGAKARLRILSNLAVMRMARASAVWKKESIGGEEAVEGILDAWAFAEADIFRAATHNKGIMNGIDAIAVATGNDWRAVEAGAHAFAAFGGRYSSLTIYSKLPNGDLRGEIELPLAVGIVGGAIRSLPSAKIALSILGVKSAAELSCVMASVGLAQNFAALRALAGEGIQRGHMELHARNLAISAGAVGNEIDLVAQQMISEKNISSSKASELLKNLRGEG
ncbi:MAG: hydroxymethylglutaryl-CoA reductase, degradative [Candidatus Micrarchaeota archaeon]|nr:hydroxymethylglutaryl-CoA reductase, degradative [Candidatus Micrarchaeota archaeon]